MLEAFARVRDIIIAVALAWLGVSIQAEPDAGAPRHKDRPTTEAAHQPNAASADRMVGRALDQPCNQADARAEVVQCLDSESCPVQ
jgi:hypothetical protein